MHLRDKPVAEGIDYVSLAALMGGMSGAQIAGVANNACYLASREGRVEVQQVRQGRGRGRRVWARVRMWVKCGFWVGWQLVMQRL